MVLIPEKKQKRIYLLIKWYVDIMKKQYIYEMKIIKTDIYRLVGVGSVVKEFDPQIFDSGMEYVRKENIGYYVVKKVTDKEVIVEIKIPEYLGDKIGCRLEFRSNMEVYYTNNISKRLICETIIIETENGKKPHEATFLKVVDNPLEEILNND